MARGWGGNMNREIDGSHWEKFIKLMYPVPIVLGALES